MKKTPRIGGGDKSLNLFNQKWTRFVLFFVTKNANRWNGNGNGKLLKIYTLFVDGEELVKLK